MFLRFELLFKLEADCLSINFYKLLQIAVYLIKYVYLYRNMLKQLSYKVKD